MADTQSPTAMFKAVLILFRICAVLQLVIGIALWTGHGYALRNVHIANGILFVLLLWIIAGTALAARRRRGLALFTLAWGLLVVGLGMGQQAILIGDLHWVVRVVHLGTAFIAMYVAALLSGVPRSADAPSRRIAA